LAADIAAADAAALLRAELFFQSSPCSELDNFSGLRGI
jgi:hypothetical protein